MCSVSVLSRAPDARPIRFRDYAGWLLLAIVALTVLFAVQQVVRMRGVGGAAAAPWGPAFALNGLDWVVWGAMVPAIVLVGERARLDGSDGVRDRLARVLVWMVLGLVLVTAVGIITGLALRASPSVFFGSNQPIRGASGQAPPLARYLVMWTSSNFSFNTLIFGVIAGSFHAALYYRDLRARRLREADLEARLARAELNVLRMQLQPHFFFNALHTVSSLMVTDVAAAQGVIASLGTLLRSSIDHTARQEIALREELAFVRHYLDVQVARFRQRLAVRIDVPDELLDALVPSLVLQPLVENAIRHGIEPNPDGGEIRIEALRSGAGQGDLVLCVSDDGSVGGGEESSTGGGGIGLANIEARLAQLYGEAHTFRAGRGADGRFSVTLQLPYHDQVGLYPTGLYATDSRPVLQSPTSPIGQSPTLREVAP